MRLCERPVAERLARVVGTSERPDVPVIASNQITDLADAEAVLAGGLIDADALARPFLADPHLVRRTLEGAAPIVCIGCDQACIDRSLVSRPVSCLVNPRAGEETRYPLRLVARPRRIAVVGGGPAGLTAALDLVRRGHAVQLLEADDGLGGQFRLAARVPGQEDYGGFVAAARRELLERGAEVRLGTRAAPGELVGFEGVVVATGVQPRRLALPGAELPHVLPYDRALREGVPPGRVVVVGGGGNGIDTATTLVEPARAPEPLAGGAPSPGPRPGAQVTVLRRRCCCRRTSWSCASARSPTEH